MKLTYEVVSEENVEVCRDLCNELMAYQKSIAHMTPELFDDMSFETRLIPSIENASHNFIMVVKDMDNEGEVVAYVYSNISPKETYASDFATFFDMNSVHQPNVGCLSQFYIKEPYRAYGIGSKLIQHSLEWLNGFNDVEDYFVFVSNGNHDAFHFYERKGFQFSHDILDGFISVLRTQHHQ